MTVRAKFTVSEISTTSHQRDARRIVLLPIYDTSIPEDQRFAQATPSGRMELYVTNPGAIERMPLGKTFYVDFTPAD